MSKYDGPSYKKNQKRLKKSEFPFYSDSAHATKKDNLFDRSKTSKYDKPIKITREINVELTEKLFSEQVNETNDERIKRLPSRQHNNHSETVQPHSHERNDLTRKNQGKILEEIVKSEEATYQERRSSTPFKVQKIPSPYYGLNKKLEQEIKKVNYRKIAVHLEKEEEEFILFDNYLCDHISKLYIEEEKIIHIEQPTIIEQPKKKLSRSLAAMIEEEQENQINSQKQRTNYFSEKSEREESTRNVNSETDFTTKPNDLNSSNELDKLETTKEKILNKKIQSEKIFVKRKDKMTEEEIENLEIKAALSRFNYIEKNSNKDKRKIDTVGIENKLTNKKLVDRQKYDDDKHWGNEKFLTEADSDLEVNSNPELDLESGADSDIKVNSNPELDLDLEADSEPKVNSNPELDLDSGADSEPEVNSNPELDLDSEADSEPEVNSNLELDLDSKADSEPELYSNPKLDLDSKADSEPEVNLNPELDLDSKVDSEPEVNSNPELDLDSEADSEPEVNSNLELDLESDLEAYMDEENSFRKYNFPTLDLLNPPVDFQSNAIDDWVLGQAELLNETLDAFNVLAQVVGWTVGPAVTQFELQLGRGVKVNKITNLSDDLKLALAAKDIRIEAPIPGKNTVGVEIPNRISRPVMLSEVMASEKFKNSDSPLTVAIGINLAGDAIVSTLDKMPHGLIAGATGSGKSVFINSILVSLLYKANPSEVKLILIDPKSVELAPYNAIPHLLSPVISEPKAASEALKWAVNEMEERYQKLALAGVRNIQRFNEKAEEHGDHALKLPYIVIVIDELADLMMVASSDVQDSIVRITQKARAAGIHLLVATQRPSVDVITGTIKNNIPTRIAFMVSSQVDSRTIMDSGGAEKLLGRGDMLFLENGASQPIRVQGTYVEKEIDSIVKHVRDQRKTNYLFEPESLMARVEAIEGKDELYEEILLFIIEEGQVSASSLQRKFKIGFNRASNIIETLENENLISPNKGSKPRDVFITEADYNKRTENRN